MNKWHAGKIKSNGISLYYTRSGGDKPPAVLAHGFSDDGLCWTPVAEKLQADYDVIMIDARGHGRSDAPEEGYSQKEMAADLAGAIQGLGLDKPAVLGHSMGGATTMVLAGTYPDIPGAILIEDSGAQNFLTGDSAEVQERLKQRRQHMVKMQSLNREQLMEFGRTETANWSEAELGPWADAKLRFDLNWFSHTSDGAIPSICQLNSQALGPHCQKCNGSYVLR